SIARELQNLTRRKGPSLKNRRISRAVDVHRSGIAESHAQEESTTQESENLTRWRAPPLGNRGISRAGTVHHSGIAESHAQEGSTAQESGNLAAGKGPQSGNGETHARERANAPKTRKLS